MKSIIITNLKSGSVKKNYDELKLISNENNFDLFDVNDSDLILDNLKNDNVDKLIVASGDGTINSVINTYYDYLDKVTFGLIPLGTGNDLARTLSIPFSIQDSFNVINYNKVTKIDLMKIETQNEIKYGVNLSTGGFSGAVNENMSDQQKKMWGPLSYLLGAITTIPDLTEYKTTVKFEDKDFNEKVFNIVVANGRTVAGGVKIAPLANPEDGFLDLIIVKSGTALQLAGLCTQIAIGDYLNNDIVYYKKIRKIQINSKPGMWFNVDGELITNEPLTISIIPSKLNVLVSELYTPEQSIL